MRRQLIITLYEAQIFIYQTQPRRSRHVPTTVGCVQIDFWQVGFESNLVPNAKDETLPPNFFSRCLLFVPFCRLGSGSCRIRSNDRFFRRTGHHLACRGGGGHSWIRVLWRLPCLRGFHQPNGCVECGVLGCRCAWHPGAWRGVHLRLFHFYGRDVLLFGSHQPGLFCQFP